MDGFLGIGFWEILLIFIIFLALLGTRRLTEIAAKLGTYFRRLRRASYDLTTQLTKEVEGNPLSEDDNPLNSLKKAAYDLKSSLKKETESTPQKEDENPEEKGREGNHHG